MKVNKLKNKEYKKRELKRIKSFNLTDSCIEKLEVLADKTKTHNKSAIIERLIHVEYVKNLAASEKAQGNILDYKITSTPHIRPLDVRVAYSKYHGLDTPKCPPTHYEGKCEACWGSN